MTPHARGRLGMFVFARAADNSAWHADRPVLATPSLVGTTNLTPLSRRSGGGVGGGGTEHAPTTGASPTPSTGSAGTFAGPTTGEPLNLDTPPNDDANDHAHDGRYFAVTSLAHPT